MVWLVSRRMAGFALADALVVIAAATPPEISAIVSAAATIRTRFVANMRPSSLENVPES